MYFAILTILIILYIFKDIFKRKTRIISIEGNIGSGKSTLISILKNKYCYNQNIIFLDEPVDEWTNIKGENILDKFYKNKNRWSYTFQNFAFITRISKIIDILNKYPYNKIIITERSIETDKNVFAKLLKDSGEMTEFEMNLYLYWYKKLVNDKNKLDKIIYVNTNPNESSERIKKRSRDEESNIELKYLNDLDIYHKFWLLNTKKEILNINGHQNFFNKKVQDKIFLDFDNFINFESN